MKKILLVVMVAFAFMACSDKNGANVPSKDKQAVKAVTSGAVDMIGKSAAAVDKELKAAGFVQAEGGLGQIAKRAQARLPKRVEAEVEPVPVIYIYNAPANYQTMTEEEGTAYIKKLFDKGECLAVVMAAYYEDKLISIQTQVMAPLKDKINLLFTENSDGMYAKLPEIDGQKTVWQGSTEKKKYTDHAQFVADIAAGQGSEAEEQAYSITKMDMTTGAIEGFVYTNYWENPDAEEQAEMQKENGFVAATGVFVVYDYSSIDMGM